MNKPFILDKPIESSFCTPGATGFCFDLTNKKIEIDFIDSVIGHGGKVSSDTLTHIYYILDGEGDFEIDEATYHARAGQLVEIPPHHTFDYKGKMKMLLIVEPPFTPDQIKHLDK